MLNVKPQMGATRIKILSQKIQSHQSLAIATATVICWLKYLKNTYPFFVERIIDMMKPITALSLKNNRVILRADLNAPIQDGHFLQDYRLKAIRPTIDYIQSQGGKVIVLTHLGRPKNHEFDAQLSTGLVAAWLEKNNYEIDYEMDIVTAREKSKQKNNAILLLENLRFFKGEKESNTNFADLLASLGDCYVNDAFGLLHRHDTSITLLPQQFHPDQRAYGFLIEREIKELECLKKNPTQPFFVVLGGCKIEDKIDIIKNLVQQDPHRRVNTILVGGLIGQILLAAQGIIPTQPQSERLIELAKKVLRTIHESGVNLFLPEDFVVTQNKSQENSLAQTLDAITTHSMCVDIGPKTVQTFTTKLSNAKTIFVNGTMGIYEDEASAQGTRSILTAIAQTKAHRVIGGGDAVAATFLFGLDKKMDYLSTGGGATLAFLASQNPESDLPGLQALTP